MRLHESAYSTYTLPTTSTQPKPLIDANNRYHSYIPSEINEYGLLLTTEQLLIYVVACEKCF